MIQYQTLTESIIFSDKTESFDMHLLLAPNEFFPRLQILQLKKYIPNPMKLTISKHFSF